MSISKYQNKIKKLDKLFNIKNQTDIISVVFFDKHGVITFPENINPKGLLSVPEKISIEEWSKNF